MSPADYRPRLVKLVRDRVAQFINADVGVEYRPIEDKAVAIEELRKKLLEECAEYLMNPSIGELADIYEVIRALAIHDLGFENGLHDIATEAREKAAERGGFDMLTGMWATTNAPARHEDR